MAAAAFLARQTLKGVLPARGVDVDFLSDHAVVRKASGAIGNTVNEIHVLSRQIDVVAKRRGRAHQAAHKYTLLILGLVALAAVVVLAVVLLEVFDQPPKMCQTSADCGGDSVCVPVGPAGKKASSHGTSSFRGVCSAAHACLSDAQCKNGASCLSGFCQPLTCATTADCLRGGSLRANPITGETAAGASVYCDTSTHQCALGCDEDADCGAGACNKVTHACVSGACSSDSDCATAIKCGIPPAAGATTAELDAYAACTQATTCSPADHTCHKPCTTQSDCGDTSKQGTVCQGGLCTTLACSSDSDCSPNELWCNTSTKECQPSCTIVPAICGSHETCNAATHLCEASA